MCDSTGRGYLEITPGFLLILPDVPFPFALESSNKSTYFKVIFRFPTETSFRRYLEIFVKERKEGLSKWRVTYHERMRRKTVYSTACHLQIQCHSNQYTHMAFLFIVLNNSIPLSIQKSKWSRITNCEENQKLL